MSWKTYYEQMAKEAGLSPEETQAVLAANEKLAGKLDPLVKTATEDYNAQVGRVKALQARTQEWETWANGNGQEAGAIAKYNQMQAQLQEAQRKADILAAAVQSGNPVPPVDPVASGAVTLADLQKFTQDLDSRWSGVLKSTSKIVSRHVREFNEDPDFDAIEKVARDKGWSAQPDGLDRAYEELVRPRLEERRAKAEEQRIANLKSEWEKDWSARHGVPSVPAAGEIDYSPIFNTGKAEPSSAEMDADLVATFVAAQK